MPVQNPTEIGVAIGPLLGALGILGIGFAFAMRDTLEGSW